LERDKMVVVNKKQLTLSGEKLVGEASSIGLALGQWPDFIAVLDDQNEGFLFERGTYPQFERGELIAQSYYSQQGFELSILND
jgi:hypothetical protein